MSLFIREFPLTVRSNNNRLRKNSIFDDFENEFFNHPLISFPSYYPFYYQNPVASLEKEMDKAFDKENFKLVDFTPKINISEDEKNYYIHADLPGMKKDQVKMEISDSDRTLTISGERETIYDSSKDDSSDDSKSKEESKVEYKEESTTNTESESKINANENKESDNTKETNKENKNNKKYSRIECSYGKFSRSFSIPENANIDNIQAKMENGVLEVTINKKIETPKPEPKHTIQIQ